MGKLFGTDGVRGKANKELTPELAFKLGKAGAQVLKVNACDKPAIIIGRDTRISGGMLEASLVAGICSAGVGAITVGVIPTPGIAYLTRELDVVGGVVISASHNSMPDNGIKFFGSNGYKLPDQVEAEIESLLTQAQMSENVPTGAEVGKVSSYPEGKYEYSSFLKRSVDLDLRGLKIVVDGANGAAYELAPKILEELGAEVIATHCEPTGLNINESCGSTHLESLQERVVSEGAHLGLAFDGDADRLLAVDEKGNIIDGDKILVICASHLKEREMLTNDLLVVTVMSNLGLHQACEKLGIKVLETKVGDRYVLEEMKKSGGVLGGEQSGHIIYLDKNTTGDGILTSLLLLSVITGTDKPVSELADNMKKLPQVLINARVKDKNNLEKVALVNEVIDKAKRELEGRGRVLVRPSGTEPLVRVMTEGPDLEELEVLTASVAKAIEEHV